MIPITLNLEPVVKLTPEQFCRLCESNPEAKLEMTSECQTRVSARKLDRSRWDRYWLRLFDNV
jgi:hypothetical protein